jgi:upstream activation factor subunit UAF30
MANSKTNPPKTVSKASSKAKKPPKASAPAPAPAPAPDPVVPETNVENVVVEPVSGLESDCSKFLGDLQNVSSQLSALKTSFRALEKAMTKELKAAQKLNKKKKQKSNRKPSGFVKPTLISMELADFLKVPHKSEIARTEVTREINKYIREHNLQDAKNGRIINADKALQTLLKVQKSDELTYFNLQKFMSPHFLKAGQEVTAIF